MAKRSVAAAVLWLWILCGIGASQAQDNRIPWKTYPDALREARDTEKPLFLYFVIDNCPYCRKMNTETLASSKVTEYLRDAFVSVRIRAETEPSLVRKYMVRGFPTSWFLTPEGKAINYLPGYLGPDDFFTVLRYIAGGHYRSMSFQEYLEGS